MWYRSLALCTVALLLHGFLGSSPSSAGAPDLRALSDELLSLAFYSAAASPQRQASTIQPAQLVPPLGVPPEPGAVVLEDALTTNQVVPTGRWCPTGKNSFESTEEGLLIKLQGKCLEQEPGAQVSAQITGLTVPDGEISFEMKATSGFERAVIAVMIRHGVNAENLYVVWWSPAPGVAGVTRNLQGAASTLKQRSDLGELFQASDWNTVVVRAQGPAIWLIVNGQPVLSVVDDSFDSGTAGLRLFRVGNPDEEFEASVTLRKLRVSKLVGSEESASPTYDTSQSPTRIGLSVIGSVPAASSPPAIGPAVIEDPLNGRGVVGATFCPTGRNSAQFREDGYVMKVTGPCREGVIAPGAVASFMEGLVFSDGEIQIEALPLSGAERASLVIATRTGPAGNDGYFAEVQPGRGAAVLGKLIDGQTFVLAQRTDLDTLFGTEEWVRVAVRFEGSSHWLLINDQQVLSAVDSTYESGRALLGMARFGDPQDDQEVGFLVRNLRVSALADGDPARAPSGP